MDTYDSSARAIANVAKAIVVSVEYRKAPESPFPAAHEDALAAYRWTSLNAASLDGDPDRIAVAGEGAGGNLAANVALFARALDVAPPIYQVLIHPVIDNDTNNASYRRNELAQPLDRASMLWFFDRVASKGADREDLRLNLLDANFASTPPALIIAAEVDPLLSEGRALAAKLPNVEYVEYPGVTHEFFGAAPVLDQARLAQTVVGRALDRAFGR